MKQKSKTTKLYLIVFAIALLFLLAVDVTYAYFSAQKSVSGNANMGQLDLWWSSRDETWFTKATNQCVATPTVNKIYRGETFGFIANDTTISVSNPLGFYGEDSSSCYVRFWVDAYTAGDTTNYGQYFILNCTNAVTSEIKNKTKIVSGVSTIVETNTIYYLSNAIDYDEANGNMRADAITGITFAEDAPLELLESGFTITICFDAVQKANGAYKTVFDDWKGYHNSWV